MKKQKLKGLFIALCIGVALIVILLPFIVEQVYYMTPPCDFFYINYDAKDVLAYYGSVLSFTGTVILGVLTLHQNKRAQEKSDEVNLLQLELQRKSMAMAEAQYSKSQDLSDIAPKFEIALCLTHGNYSGLVLSIKNVTSMVTSCLTAISVIATDVDGKEIAKATKMTIAHHSLSAMQDTNLSTDFPELGIRSNVTLAFSFSCEDEKGNIHYYRATADIPSTKNYYAGLWHVEKVG